MPPRKGGKQAAVDADKEKAKETPEPSTLNYDREKPAADWTLDDFYTVFLVTELEIPLANIDEPPKRIRQAASMGAKNVQDVAKKIKNMGPQLKSYPVVVRRLVSKTTPDARYEMIDGDTRTTIYRADYPDIVNITAKIFHEDFPNSLIFRFQSLINMTTQTSRLDTVADTIIKIQNIRQDYPNKKDAKQAIIDQGLIVKKTGQTVSPAYLSQMFDALTLPNNVLDIIFDDCETNGSDSSFTWAHLIEPEFRNVVKASHRSEDLKSVVERIRAKKLTVKDMKEWIKVLNGRREMDTAITLAARKIKGCIKSEAYELAHTAIYLGTFDKAWATNGKDSPAFQKCINGVKDFNTDDVETSKHSAEDEGVDEPDIDGGAGAGAGGETPPRNVRKRRPANWVYHPSPFKEGYDQSTDGSTLPEPQEQWQLRSSWSPCIDAICLPILNFAKDGKMGDIDLILCDPPGNILKGSGGQQILLRDQFIDADIIDMAQVLFDLVAPKTSVIIWTPHQLMPLYIEHLTANKKLKFIQPLYTYNSSPHSSGPSNKLTASVHTWLLFSPSASGFHNYPDHIKEKDNSSRRYADAVSVDFRVPNEDKILNDSGDDMARPEQKSVSEIERFVLQFSRKEGTVVDLCAGTATTGVCALQHQRRVFMYDCDEDIVTHGQGRMRRLCEFEEQTRLARQLRDKHPSESVKYLPGDLVLCNRTGRFSSKLSMTAGPYIVRAEVKPDVYRLEHPASGRILEQVASTMMAEFLFDRSALPDETSLSEFAEDVARQDDKDLYYVDAILAHRYASRNKHDELVDKPTSFAARPMHERLRSSWFKVHWLNYDSSEDTWEPYRNLKGNGVLAAWLAANPHLNLVLPEDD